MEYLELDLEKIARLGEQNEEENFGFRIFLKSQDTSKVDKIVYQLNKEITSQIDCQKCGNCCKSLKPCIKESDIKKFAQTMNVSPADFLSRFVEKDTSMESKHLNASPCIFLKNKTCTIYDDRPDDCRSFPHTQKPGFISRTLSMIHNYGICPIVFNLFEELKFELKYRRL